MATDRFDCASSRLCLRLFYIRFVGVVGTGGGRGQLRRALVDDGTESSMLERNGGR